MRGRVGGKGRRREREARERRSDRPRGRVACKRVTCALGLECIKLSRDEDCEGVRWVKET